MTNSSHRFFIRIRFNTINEAFVYSDDYKNTIKPVSNVRVDSGKTKLFTDLMTPN